MDDKIYSIDELIDIVSPIAKQYDIKMVYLFGSYAHGEATDTSDIDLCIDTENLTTLFDSGGLNVDLEKALNKSLDLITVQMTNGKSIKRALLSSAFSLIICVAMLIGTTFAWFTDTASTAVNKIQVSTKS